MYFTQITCDNDIVTGLRMGPQLGPCWTPLQQFGELANLQQRLLL